MEMISISENLKQLGNHFKFIGMTERDNEIRINKYNPDIKKGVANEKFT